MTIDEEIVFERKLADYYKENHLKNEAKEHEQRAEWFEELKALKNGLNIKCDNLNEALEKGKKVGYNKAIDDFVQKVKEHQYVLSDVINSKDYGMFTIGIEQIAEQLKEKNK